MRAADPEPRLLVGLQAHWYPVPLIVVVTVTVRVGEPVPDGATDDVNEVEAGISVVEIPVPLELMVEVERAPPSNFPPTMPGYWLAVPIALFR